jgi:hypothetical protein
VIPKFKEATMEPTPDEVKRAARQLREHFQKHRDPCANAANSGSRSSTKTTRRWTLWPAQTTARSRRI